MGGWLTVAIREADGTEYISQRNTNWLPDWLVKPRFWTGKQVVKEYIASGLEAFTPVARAYPDQYGIILFDFVNKKVMSRQGYTGIGKTFCAFIGSEKAEYLLTMIKRGWVTRYECWRPKEEEDRDLDPKEVEAFHELLRHWLHPTEEEEQRSRHGRSYGSAKFGPGMVTVHFQPPGWTLDVKGDDKLLDNWDEVRNFMKNNGWKSKSWTQREVDKQYKDPRPAPKPKKKAKAA